MESVNDRDQGTGVGGSDQDEDNVFGEIAERYLPRLAKKPEGLLAAAVALLLWKHRGALRRVFGRGGSSSSSGSFKLPGR